MQPCSPSPSSHHVPDKCVPCIIISASGFVRFPTILPCHKPSLVVQSEPFPSASLSGQSVLGAGMKTKNDKSSAAQMEGRDDTLSRSQRATEAVVISVIISIGHSSEDGIFRVHNPRLGRASAMSQPKTDLIALKLTGREDAYANALPGVCTSARDIIPPLASTVFSAGCSLSDERARSYNPAVAPRSGD